MFSANWSFERSTGKSLTSTTFSFKAPKCNVVQCAFFLSRRLAADGPCKIKKMWREKWEGQNKRERQMKWIKSERELIGNYRHDPLDADQRAATTTGITDKNELLPNWTFPLLRMIKLLTKSLYFFKKSYEKLCF